MKKILTIVAIAALVGAAPVYAGGQGQLQGQIANAQNEADAVNEGVQNEIGDINVNIDQSSSEDRSLPQRSESSSQNNVNYSGSYRLKNVPNVTAPALTTTLTETCMGSTSAGAGWVGFGFSFGTTWRDSACVRRLDARQLHSLGYPLGAKELMCDSPAVAAALARAGRPCYNDLPQEVKAEIAPVVAPAPADTDALLGAGK